MKKQSNHQMSGNLWRRGSGILAAALPAALLIVTCGGSQLRAEAIVSQPQTLLTNTVGLELQTTDRNTFRSSVLVSARETGFKKEPGTTGKILRGVLKFSDDPTNAIAFLWQRDAGKLLLDLNRNEDFTDDPAGVFSTGLNRALNNQIFTNISLNLATTAGRYPLLADLNLWDYGTRLGCSVTWRSYWQGEMTVAGQHWQVGVIPDTWVEPNGHRSISFEHHLLLRPRERRNEPITLGSDSLDTIALSSFSQKLFFAGHEWQLSLLTDTSKSEFHPALKFVEQTITLGDLKMAGKFIQRLTVQSDGYLAVLDHPAETVTLPVGDYHVTGIWLEQNGTRAYNSDGRWPQGGHFSIAEKAPGSLAVGGPLTNSVAVTRHGRDLRMDYRIIGVGGQAYQLVNQDRSHPPAFAIFKGDKKITSGNFEFG